MGKKQNRPMSPQEAFYQALGYRRPGGYGSKHNTPTDDVQNLANSVGKNIHISSNGGLSFSDADTIDDNVRAESGTNHVTNGNCGQGSENLPKK